MLVKDYETYKAVYCSLCKQLGKEYYFLSRFILSYDCTFFALIALALKSDCPGFCHGRCTFNPLKKCNYIKKETEVLSMAAALSIISAYYKLRDNITDGGFFEKLGCYLVLPVFSIWHKKASRKYPDIETAISYMSESQADVEKDNNCCVDKACEPTALMLGNIMSILANKEDDEYEKKKRIYHSFGYFIGKWIYLCDAIDDFDKDEKRHLFNPYVILYGDQKSAHIKEINESLNHCLCEALLSYGLMDINRFDSIIENILIKGLPLKQKNILYKDKTTTE